MTVLLAGLAFGGASAAQDDLPAKVNVYFGGGSFKPREDSTLTRREGDFSLDAGLGWRVSRRLAWEIGYLFYVQDTDPPASLAIGGTGSGQAMLTVSGFGGVLKLVQPAGPFEFFAGAGLGYYESELSVSGVNFLTFRSRTVSRTDNGWGQQYVAGVHIGAVTVQYRRVDLKADFGPDIGSAKAGGTMWQVLLRAGLGPLCTECRK